MAREDRSRETPLLLVEDVGFGEVVEPLELPVREGGYTIGLDTDDDALMDVSFVLGHLPVGSPVRLDPRGPTAFLRVMHASPEAPAVDVFLEPDEPVDDD